MKLYTKRGDDGGTDLYKADRVSKTDLRICAIGEVDEANAAIGLATAGCRNGKVRSILLDVQSRMFDLGADLATPDPNQPRRITQAHIEVLEKAIDTVCVRLPEMKHFILPGGGELSAHLHFARAVIRRAERACVALKEQDDQVADAVIYLNRLSDLFFALARLMNQKAGIKDIPWLGTPDVTHRV